MRLSLQSVTGDTARHMFWQYGQRALALSVEAECDSTEE